MKVKEIQLDKIKLHTEHFGDISNPTCLLISGAMAPARFWTDFFCDNLAANGYFVIRYDHRDIGESCAIDWQKEPYTLFDLASDAIGILDHYKIKKAHFVGHSMGGGIFARQLGFRILIGYLAYRLFLPVRLVQQMKQICY